MADYIDRETVIKIINTEGYNIHDMLFALKTITARSIPAADVVPVVHGRWEVKYVEDAEPFQRRRFYCSACGDWTTYGETRCCPNCGARMDGEA